VIRLTTADTVSCAVAVPPLYVSPMEALRRD
jgi:hypothetical protein